MSDLITTNVINYNTALVLKYFEIKLLELVEKIKYSL